MAKSIRSKREKRLRTLRRAIVTKHIAGKEDPCRAVLDAIVNAPSPYTLHLNVMAQLRQASQGNSSSSGAGAAAAAKTAEEGAEGGRREGGGGADGNAMAVDTAPGGNSSSSPSALLRGALRAKGAVKKKWGAKGAGLGSLKKKVKMSSRVRRKLNRSTLFPV